MRDTYCAGGDKDLIGPWSGVLRRSAVCDDSVMSIMICYADTSRKIVLPKQCRRRIRKSATISQTRAACSPRMYLFACA
eukprot:1176948-Prorocentrum_minimum.AAC.4